VAARIRGRGLSFNAVRYVAMAGVGRGGAGADEGPHGEVAGRSRVLLGFSRTDGPGNGRLWAL